MITFEKFSERLARGQLKNMAAVDKTNLGVISPDYMESILSLTDQGLTDLHTRFPLVKKQIDLVFVADQHIYPLADGAPYLDDSDSQTETFVQENFVKVLDIYDEDGVRYSPRTSGHIMQPAYDSLRFTSDIMETLDPKIRIRYQAQHAKLVDETSEIVIPPNMVTALQLFVASLYISHMNGSDHSAKGDSYFAAYLRHIGDDESRDTSSTSEVEEDARLEDRGFV
jgi:hypothetical protein